MNLMGNINAIPFRRFRGGGGVSPIPPFPSISGITARYSALGLTNEQMAANPVWVDKTGNGHDLQMKNFLWGGMSGVGGYKLNWGDSSIWANYIAQGALGTGEVTNNTIHITSAKTNNALFETRASLKSVEYKVLVKGLTDDIYLRYGVFNDGKELWTGIKNDGIYTLPSCDYDSRYNMKWKVMSQTYPIDCNITIEQLPLYPGALVFDGVDDYGVCENFPILTKEKGYTVVALRQWITRGEGTLGLISNVKIWLRDGAFILEFRDTIANRSNNPISFGTVGGEMDLPHTLTYQTSKSYNGVSITTGSFKGTDVLHVGKLAMTGFGGNYSNAAIWEIVILDHDATEEELTKIKDYFVKTYPWLFPDQAWTVVGKTNEDGDRATIANITGNGNDLVLSNFAFSGNSGYGEYAYNFNDTSWISIPDYGVISDKTSKSFNIKSFVLANYPVLYTAVNKDSSIKKVKIKVTNSIPGFYFGNKPANQIIDLSTDGIYEIPSYNSPNDVTQYGFRCSNVNDSCNITIEQIPEYEGYLVTDGVDDKIVSSSFGMGKDFTVVGEWTLLQNINVSSLRKQSSFIIRNNELGLSLFINRISHATLIHTKSLRAFCSNGVLYKSDWTEQIDTTPQDITSSNSELLIASHYDNKSEYDKIAFKNLAIYPTVLSKEDCIKAYNYLQTLKAK